MAEGEDNPPPELVEDKPLVGAVAIKLPPFWPADPIIWFAQAEAQFLTRGIKCEDTKFAHIIASLQPEFIQEVRELVISPPKETPYAILKEQLIKRTSASEQKRVQMLLTEEELGDKKPSQLLRRMRQLLSERKLEDGILKQLFLQRLPSNAQLILASSSDTVTLDQLAILADRILEVSVPAANAVSVPPPPTSELTGLREQIANLTLQVNALQSAVKRSKSRSRSRPRLKDSPSETSDSPSICWYHNRYGDKARKCNPPCTYMYTSQAGNDPTRG